MKVSIKQLRKLIRESISEMYEINNEEAEKTVKELEEELKKQNREEQKENSVREDQSFLEDRISDEKMVLKKKLKI